MVELINLDLMMDKFEGQNALMEFFILMVIFLLLAKVLLNKFPYNFILNLVFSKKIKLLLFYHYNK